MSKRSITPDEQRGGAAAYLELAGGSGPGSSLDNTANIRRWLPDAILRYGIRSIADIPCGDWRWMWAVDLSGIDYAGYDLLSELIERNRAVWADVKFEQLNIITTAPPRADLILCRDLLVHLSYEHALAAIGNFRKSGSRFLACTTFPGAKNEELYQSMTGWGWRALNMEAEPFNLGQPIDGTAEVEAGKFIKMYTL